MLLVLAFLVGFVGNSFSVGTLESKWTSSSIDILSCGPVMAHHGTSL